GERPSSRQSEPVHEWAGPHPPDQDGEDRGASRQTRPGPDASADGVSSDLLVVSLDSRAGVTRYWFNRSPGDFGQHGRQLARGLRPIRESLSPGPGRRAEPRALPGGSDPTTHTTAQKLRR